MKIIYNLFRLVICSLLFLNWNFSVFALNAIDDSFIQNVETYTPFTFLGSSKEIIKRSANEDVSPCSAPSTATVSNILHTSATLTWTATNPVPANGYEYFISASPIAPIASTVGVLSSTTTARLINLASGSNYYVWIRAYCSVIDSSEWTQVATFQTNCDAGSSLPWTESFEAVPTATNIFTSGVVPPCWTATAKSGVVTDANTSVQAKTGANVLAFQYSTGVNTWAYTPGFNLQANQSYRFSFYYRNTNTTPFDSLRVYIGRGQTSGAMSTRIGSVLRAINNTTYFLYVVDFTVPFDDVFNIGINVHAGTSPTLMMIDDVKLELSQNCLSPSNISLSDLTMANVNLAWSAPAVAPGNGYEYYNSSSITAPTSTTTGIATSATSVSFSTLSPNTNYYFWVRSVCNTTDNSIWIGPFVYRTPCGVVNIPYIQNFETATEPSIPECTSTQNVGFGNNWVTVSEGGNKRLSYNYNFSNPANTWFYTQGVNLVAGTSYRISYIYKATIGYVEKMNVAYGMSQSENAMTNAIANHSNITNVDYQANPASTDFIPTTSGVYYFGFHAYSTAGQNKLYIDNITVDLSPNCLIPSGMAANDVTMDNATISWTLPSGMPVNGFEYYNSTYNTAPTAATVGIGNPTTSVTLSNLTSNTQHFFWVRSVCSSTEKSLWAGPFTYTTSCEFMNVPYLQNFESANVPAIPDCNSRQNIGSGNNWKTIIDGGSRVLIYNYSTSNAADTWFYTQGVNLVGGTSYRISYKYKGTVDYVERMNVAYGMAPNADDMIFGIANHSNIVNSSYQATPVHTDFTPAHSGVYYFGFHAYSDVFQAKLYVDDILVDLSPSCMEPQSFTISSITTSAATVSWTVPTPTPAIGYEYYVGMSSVAPLSTTIGVSTTNTTVTLSDLSPSTTYYVWVRSHCSNTDLSAWSRMNVFTTSCGVITTLPWMESFDGVVAATSSFVSGIVPSCWLGTSKTGVVTNANNSIVARSGTNALVFTYSTGIDTWAYTPEFQLEVGQSYRYSFYYRNSNTIPFDSLRVFIGQGRTPAVMSSRIGFVLRPINNQEYALYEVDFTVPSSGVYNLGINVNGSINPLYMMIDDMQLGFTPCSNPTAVISGGQGACSVTNFTPAQVILTGIAPWSIALSNGVHTQQVTATVSPYVFHPATGGTYFITNFSDATCVGTASGIASFNYTPTTIRNNSVIICEGDVFEFNGRVHSTAGIYNDYFIMENGCDSLVVTNLSFSNFQAVGIYDAGSERLVASPVQGAAYTWYNCETNTIVSLNESFKPTVNGQYKVSIKIGGCVEVSTCITVANATISEVKEENVILFPNPTSDIVTIDAGGQVIDRISIVDQKGKIIASYTIDAVKAKVSLDNLSEGIYFLQIESSGYKVVKKVFKK